MSEVGIKRRDFLKIMGWSGASLTLGGCGNAALESGAELVESQSQPEDFVIPGIAVYYASTCTQCEAACAVHGRVREGRILKLEGNPDSSINQGKICGLGQAAVQAHYNPDRLTKPMIRKGGKLQDATWDEAMALLTAKVGPASGLSGDQFAFLTGSVSGHLKVLLQNYVASLGSKNHFTYEALSPAVSYAVNKKVYGAEAPQLHLDKAKAILSFGADFLGTWVSPVNFARQYTKFRKAPRGVLIQVEPKMTMTGANADRWIPIRPGTEGILAMGIANQLLQDAAYAKNAPADAAAATKPYTKEMVGQATGVPTEHIDRLVKVLKERSPSLVLSGPSAEGVAHGSQNAAAIALLNIILGNIGKTIEVPAGMPFPQIAPVNGTFAGLRQFNDGLSKGQYKAVFVYNSNPVYTAPGFMKLKDSMGKAPFKVVFAQMLDETATEADLILPLDSALEDWGTHVAHYQPSGSEISIQQPLMEKLYANGTRSMGDITLDLLKQRRPEEYKQWPDYYAYLRTAFIQAKAALGKAGSTDDTFWREALSVGVINVPAGPAPATHAAAISVSLPAPDKADSQYPFQLVPYVSHAFGDGRHANLPWMQETPDPLTTVVWDSWAEMHPKTAAKLGVKEGDVLEITSADGSLKVPAYIFPGIHPDVISIPVGQGHEALGRYAKGRGVNVMKLLSPVFDKETGELALFATRVKVVKTGKFEKVVKDEGPNEGKQHGRKLVATLPADKIDLTKEV
jgi:molybdopterin-containing oxidoreductase family iron-sulfur binding subunit